MKRYKISNFARKMGVTTDLVKHYQDTGIISPEVDKENGYRYYTIRHGERIIASRKYRELGFGVSQTKEILYDRTADEIMDMMEQKTEETKRTVEMLKLKLERLEEVHDEMMDSKENASSFQIRKVPGYYYIHHVLECEFIESQELHDEIITWIKHLDFSYKCYHSGEQGVSTIGVLVNEHYYNVLGYNDYEHNLYWKGEERLIYFYHAPYLIEKDIMSEARKYLEKAKELGYPVKNDEFVVQHIFDENKDGVRYINYRFQYFLDNKK